MSTSAAPPLAGRIADARRAQGRCVVCGLAGAQGAGKTTLARALVDELARGHGMRAFALSLDDFYLTRDERAALADAVHPLLATRGVPGTHDVALATRTLDALASATGDDEVACPAFDKARDDRAPEAEWPRVRGPLDAVILEGWCLGAKPEDDAALAAPINDLEREHDAEGRFRAHVNRQLAGPYRPLFARIDLLAFLAAPGFEPVLRWRRQQERELAARVGDGAPGLLDEAALSRFVQHFERLTRHMLASLPAEADVVVELDAERRVLSVCDTRG